LRRDADTDGDVPLPGIPITRNPGICAVWVTRMFSLFNPDIGGPGQLFQLGPPTELCWFREGRSATLPEIEDAIAETKTILMDAAMQDPTPGAVQELKLELARLNSTMERLANLRN
jgi:hypothetical protein